jgi:two-component system, cell cycle response regulator
MAEEARRPRILVVDDTRYHRELARQVLRDLADVECCGDAESALELLARGRADLVLSDLTMPGLSGLELLERVQREHPGTDFVLITANASVDSAVRALRMGATDYLQKPVRAEDLVLVVERTLARRALVEENLRLRDERAILEACKSLTPCLEPEDVYSVALDLFLRALRRRTGLVLYHRTSIPTTDGIQFRGLREDEESCVRSLLGRHKPLDLDGFAEGARLARGPVHDALRESGVAARELFVLPARGQETERGVFFALDEGRPFEPHEIELAGLVIGHTSVSLRNAERYHRARERAFVDDVTEIYNARYLLEAMDREIRRAERYGSELSVLFLDLDRFKLVNDRHGHLVGSEALRQLSRLLSQCVRQVDTLARYGGDEFTILLVDTGLDGALSVAERIRQSVADHAFGAERGLDLRLTISVGVSTFPSHGESRERLLDLADKAMYLAKALGRDHVCSANELSSSGSRGPVNPGL